MAAVDRVDVAVVGAGIVGLASAWQLLRRHPGLSVCIVEREAHIAAHQSSHNSGVLHAGIYYQPGSLKARLCVEGKRQLEDYAAARGIRVDRTGKLIIAAAKRELPGLHELARRAVANGVPDTRLVDADELRALEPAARGVAALHSPTTAVTDFVEVCRALATDVGEAGAELRLGWAVAAIERSGDGARLHAEDGDRLDARAVLTCAGVESDRISGQTHDTRIVPFRGSWYRLSPRLARHIRGSIYPVPDPRLPFLGVHLTRRINGQVWVGPNAFLSFDRTRYRRWAVRAGDVRATVTFPGFWRFARKNLRAAAVELSHDVSRRAYAAALRRYVPDVTAADLRRGPMGIRAQALHRDGYLLDDFLLARDGPVVHVLNAPSPAGTSALAIADQLADEILQRLA